jgi:hypothetical protein
MQNALEFHAYEISRETIFRNSQIQHASNHRGGLKYGYFVSVQSKIIGARDTGWSGAYYSDLDTD